jgi:hypothetical protein
MDDILIATLITEGGKLLSEFMRSSQAGKRGVVEVQWPEIPEQLPNFTDPFADRSAPKIISSEVKIIPVGLPEVNYAPVQSPGDGEKVATSCVGCAIGHLATVSGLLKECVRFTGEGMDSPNIVDRLNTCLDELNAMERVDLLPNKIQLLPDWEKDLAHRALNVSRETRHFIEAGITSPEQFEKVAANLINERQAIGNAWLQQKLRALSTEDKEVIAKRVMARLENISEEKQ